MTLHGVSQSLLFFGGRIIGGQKIRASYMVGRTDKRYYEKAHLLRVGWRNFFPVVLLCQFLVLVGNRFWFYILTGLEYNTVGIVFFSHMGKLPQFLELNPYWFLCDFFFVGDLPQIPSP